LNTTIHAKRSLHDTIAGLGQYRQDLGSIFTPYTAWLLVNKINISTPHTPSHIKQWLSDNWVTGRRVALYNDKMFTERFSTFVVAIFYSCLYLLPQQHFNNTDAANQIALAVAAIVPIV